MTEVFAGRLALLSFGGALYAGVATDRPAVVVEGQSDEDGIRQLLGVYAGVTLVCAPELAEAAAALGCATRSPTPDEARTIAVEAWAEARAAGLGAGAAPAVSLRFLETAARYIQSAVHRDWPFGAALELELTPGENPGTRRAVVVEAGHRVTVLPTLDDVVDLLDSSYVGERQQILFGSEPAYATAALEAAGFPGVTPIPGKVSGPMGDVTWLPVPEAMLVELELVLAALQKLDPAQPHTSVDERMTDARGMEQRVRLRRV
jgi:hypothetical protein